MIIATDAVNTALRYAAEFKPGLEVAGFGRTTLMENDLDILVDEIYIPPQIVQAAHADIKGPGEAGGDGMLEEFLHYIATHCHWCRGGVEEHDPEDGHDFEGEAWNNWRLWWHSHGKLEAKPSATDDDSLRKLARLLGGWSVGLVINAAGARHAWAAVHQPPFNVLLQHTDFTYYQHELPEVKRRIEEMMERVEEKKYTPPTNNWQGNPSPTYGAAKKNSSGSNTGASSATEPLLLPRLPHGKRIIDLDDTAFANWLHGKVEEVKAGTEGEE